jgi:hypothetical protein
MKEQIVSKAVQEERNAKRKEWEDSVMVSYEFTVKENTLVKPKPIKPKQAKPKPAQSKSKPESKPVQPKGQTEQVQHGQDKPSKSEQKQN